MIVDPIQLHQKPLGHKKLQKPVQKLFVGLSIQAKP